MHNALETEVKRMQQAGFPQEVIQQHIAIQTQLAADQIPMSQRDGLSIQSTNGNTSGAYISEYQQSQDRYGELLMQQEQQQRQQQSAAAELSRQPLDRYGNNPNVKIETEGQQTTVLPNGTIVHY